MPATKTLTPKQKLFVLEYCKDFNATAAYLRAGYAGCGAGTQPNAHNLLLKHYIQSAIKKQLEARCQRLALKGDEVLEEWRLIGHSDIINYFGVNPDGTEFLKKLADIDPLARRAISSLKIKRRLEGPPNARYPVEIIELRQWPKNEALQNLGRVAGLAVDPPQLPPTPAQITFVLVESRDAANTATHVDGTTCEPSAN